MTLVALALTVAVAQSPLVSLSETQLDDKLAEAHKQLNFGERIETLSKLFLGTPYADFPLGEGGTGPEPQPRFRLDAVDCQTFVETVLSFANAKSVKEAKAVLDDIRYGKEPLSFATRNHFTEAEWMPANIDKGYLREEVQSIDGAAPQAVLVLRREQWAKNEALQRLVPADVPEGKFPVRYLPIGQLKKRASSIEPGSIILVVRDADPHRVVRVSHMGFVVRSGSGLAVRHATPTSDLGHQVVDEPLGKYLDRMASFKKWPVAGFGLLMPLDAKLRATQVVQAVRQQP